MQLSERKREKFAIEILWFWPKFGSLQNQKTFSRNCKCCESCVAKIRWALFNKLQIKMGVSEITNEDD